MARLLLSVIVAALAVWTAPSVAVGADVNCDTTANPSAPISIPIPPAAFTATATAAAVAQPEAMPTSGRVSDVPMALAMTPTVIATTPAMVPQPTIAVAAAPQPISTTARAEVTTPSLPVTSALLPSSLSVAPISATTATPPTASPATNRFENSGTTGLGTCYEPMHSQLYPLHGGDSSRVGEILDRDLQQLSRHFSVLRTYHAQYFGLRIADYASKFNLKLFIGLAKFPQRPDWEEIELQAAVDGARQHPGTVEAIIVGSEDLVQAGGSQSVDMILARVETVRQRLQAAGVTGVRVGSAQRINELVNPSLTTDMDRLVAGCDFVGVNIYPFFAAGFDARDPVALLDAQWAQLRTRFGDRIAKLRVTETGWPSAGAAPPAFPSNAPSAATQRAYFHAVANWQPRDMAGAHFWFMAYDRRSDDAMVQGATIQYEQFFGVFTSDNADKGVL